MLVWCNEDTPFIWRQIIRTMGNLPIPQKIRGDVDLFRDIMPAQAFQKFQGYLEAHPSMDLSQLRRVMTAFAQKFAITETMIEELDALNSNEKHVQTLTKIYNKHLEAISCIAKTDLILP